MRRKWIVGVVALTAVGGTAVAATSVVGGDSDSVRPDYTTVEVTMDAASATPAGLRARKPKKATVLYFQGSGTVPVAQTGKFIDLRLSTDPASACKRVVTGGAVAENTDVYQQGTAVGPGTGEYHVFLAFDDAGALADFNFVSHLICLKGTK